MAWYKSLLVGGIALLGRNEKARNVQITVGWWLVALLYWTEIKRQGMFKSLMVGGIALLDRNEKARNVQGSPGRNLCTVLPPTISQILIIYSIVY